MGTNIERGFTVIETMLFLAISAVLVIALLAGSGTSISIQRYRDSVVSLQSVLQDQYFHVTNVSNTPPTGALTCDTDANVSKDPYSPPTTRGQGNCVVIGKYVTIVDTRISSDTVVGYNSKSGSSYADDIEELKDHNLAILPDSNESSDLEWGTRIAWPTSGKDAKSQTTPRTIAMLILRSPTSGLIYTFTTNSIPGKLEDVVIKGNNVPGQGEQILCIDSNGLFAGGLSIFINSYASSSNAIETHSNDVYGDSQC